ncbi:uncharacterized protein TNCT_400292 [Trichonephila clavata]|uniref:Uncharacterized protein n=1 Tax=Trichonephila clavata TaxID=2740835 RepID=A0A8X6LHQ3_TRICU|nr:uncharacterized protein TNCT_400292 [Trichonephila clavata]
MVTSSNGHLKAYSYDGVSPNLPVPFRARFRQRAPEESPSIEAHTESERLSMSPQISCERTDQGHRVAFEAEGEDLQLRVSILWLAASMAQLQSLILYTLGHEQLREVSFLMARQSSLHLKQSSRIRMSLITVKLLKNISETCC